MGAKTRGQGARIDREYADHSEPTHGGAENQIGGRENLGGSSG
jgi:hypothetical protein